MKQALARTAPVGVSLIILTFAPLGALEEWEDPPPIRDSGYGYTQEELLQRLSALRNDSDQSRAYDAVIAVFFDERHLADILARVSHDGQPPKFRYRDLRTFLVDHVDPDLLRMLGEEQDFQGWVTLGLLDRYVPVFDVEALAIYFTTPPEERSGGVIHLTRAALPDLSSAVGPSKHSFFMNFFNLMGYEDQEGFYELSMEGAWRGAPWVLEGHMDWTPKQREAFDYNNLRLIRDYPDRLSRLTVGETQTFPPRILTSDRMQGVKYSTEFGLYPQLVTEPISEYSFLLKRDSRVEIWVNGRHFDTLRLRTGPYDLLDFPLHMGLNNVELRITDDLGRKQTLNFNSIKGPNLLAPGWNEYSWSAGVRGGGSEYSDEWVLGAYYRRGITDTFTLAGEARSDEEHTGLGIGADFATRWFFGSADLGTTYTGCGVGVGGRLVLTRYFKNFSASYRCDFRDRRFLKQGQDVWSERVKALHELSVTVPRMGCWGSLRMNAAAISRYEGKDEHYQDLTWSYVINNRWACRLEGGHSRVGSDEEWKVLCQVTYNFYDDRFRRRHDVRAGSNGYHVYSTLGGNPRERFGDWQINHTHIHPEDGKGSDTVRGDFRYSTHRFNAHYTGEVGEFFDENNVKHLLNVNTALAYVDGEWGVGEPIVNAFALVKPCDRLSDIEVTAYSGGYETKGSKKWPGLLPNLMPYYPNLVSVDAGDDSFILEQEPWFVVPHYKSGTLLCASNGEGEGGTLGAHGVLYDHFGNLLAFTPIVATNLENPDAEPFISFTNEQGVFRIGGLEGGVRYRLEVGLVPGRSRSGPIYEIELPEETEEFQEFELGDLHPINEAPKYRSSIPKPVSLPVEEQLVEPEIKVDYPFVGLMKGGSYSLVSNTSVPFRIPPVPQMLTPRLGYRYAMPLEVVHAIEALKRISSKSLAPLNGRIPYTLREQSPDILDSVTLESVSGSGASEAETLSLHQDGVKGVGLLGATERAVKDSLRQQLTVNEWTASLQSSPPEDSGPISVQLRAYEESDLKSLNALRRAEKGGQRWERLQQTQSWVQHLGDQDFLMVASDEEDQVLAVGCLHIDERPRYRDTAKLHIWRQGDMADVEEALLQGVLSFAYDELELFRLEVEIVGDDEARLDLYRQHGFVIDVVRKSSSGKTRSVQLSMDRK